MAEAGLDGVANGCVTDRAGAATKKDWLTAAVSEKEEEGFGRGGMREGIDREVKFWRYNYRGRKGGVTQIDWLLQCAYDIEWDTRSTNRGDGRKE